MKFVSLALVVVLLMMLQQPLNVVAQRQPTKGPFAWDDDVMRELRAVREDHVKMASQITTNTQRLADIERRMGESDQAQLSERIASLEGRLGLMLAVALGTFGTMVASSGAIFRYVWILKRHSLKTASDIGELKEQTNSKMDRLLKVTGESERAKGVIEGKADQS